MQEERERFISPALSLLLWFGSDHVPLLKTYTSC